MRNVKIIGFGTFVPESYVMFGDQKRYRILNNSETQLSMGVKSAERALNNANMTIDDIDCIIGACACPMQLIPCNAALFHENLAKGKDIPAFDVGTTCTSFITAFDMASYLIDAGRYKNILIISSEVPSIALNPKQKESFELFSDGAASFVISKSNGESGVISSNQNTYSEGAHLTEIKAGGSMHPGWDFNGENIADYQFNMSGLKILRLTMEKLKGFMKNINTGDFDLIVPHQASKSLRTIMKRLDIPNEKFVDIVKDYGNMVSVSVPFALAYSLEKNKVKRGQKILLIGTAAGLTISSLSFVY